MLWPSSNSMISIDPSNPFEIRSMDIYAEGVPGGSCVLATKSGLIGLGVACVEQGDILVFVKRSWPFMFLKPVGQRFIFHGFA
jgi:hypothetical protein